MFHIWCGPGAHHRGTQFLAVQCVSIFNDVSRKALFIVNKASGDVLCCILIVFVTLKKSPRSGMSMCPGGTQCAPGAHCRGTQFLAVHCVSIFNDVSQKALSIVNKASGDVLCCILIVFVTLKKSPKSGTSKCPRGTKRDREALAESVCHTILFKLRSRNSI